MDELDEMLKRHIVLFLLSHETLGITTLSREWRSIVLSKQHTRARWGFSTTFGFQQLCREACYICDRIHEVPMIKEYNKTFKKIMVTCLGCRNFQKTTGGNSITRLLPS